MQDTQDAGRPTLLIVDDDLVTQARLSAYFAQEGYRTLTADFQNRVQRELAALLGPRGIAYELIRVEEAPVIGAAVAGLM